MMNGGKPSLPPYLIYNDSPCMAKSFDPNREGKRLVWFSAQSSIHRTDGSGIWPISLEKTHWPKDMPNDPRVSYEVPAKSSTKI